MEINSNMSEILLITNLANMHFVINFISSYCKKRHSILIAYKHDEKAPGKLPGALIYLERATRFELATHGLGIGKLDFY